MEYASPVHLTPPKFNVTCLTSDILEGNGASPLWYQTIDFESSDSIYENQAISDPLEAVNHPLSMTVIERSESHVTVLNEGNNRHHDHVDFNNDNRNENCSRVTIDNGENNGRDNGYSHATIDNGENNGRDNGYSHVTIGNGENNGRDNGENNEFSRQDNESIGLMKRVSTAMGFDVNKKPWKRYRWNGNRLEEEEGKHNLE